MTVRKVVKYGTPSLREKSKEVHKISKKVQHLWFYQVLLQGGIEGSSEDKAGWG